MLASLITLAFAPALPSYPGGLPPFSPALGRPLAWDPYGLYALDAEGPLEKADADILDQVRAGELGRAEALCRVRIQKDGEDVLPAWMLGQIVRVHRSADAEYRRYVEGHIDEPDSPAVLLYRLHVCRLAHDETLKPPSTKVKFDRRQILGGEMEALSSQLRSCADRRLGVAIGITQGVSFPPLGHPLDRRAVLESYRRANLRGVDVRPLLCKAYSNGTGYGLALFPDGHREMVHHADEPQPKKALEIALSILKDRPNDAFGHFHAGRSYAALGLPKTARREILAAIDAGGLTPPYGAVARQYIETGNEDAFFARDVAY